MKVIALLSNPNLPKLDAEKIIGDACYELFQEEIEFDPTRYTHMANKIYQTNNLNVNQKLNILEKLAKIGIKINKSQNSHRVFLTAAMAMDFTSILRIYNLGVILQLDGILNLFSYDRYEEILKKIWPLLKDANFGNLALNCATRFGAKKNVNWLLNSDIKYNSYYPHPYIVLLSENEDFFLQNYKKINYEPNPHRLGIHYIIIMHCIKSKMIRAFTILINDLQIGEMNIVFVINHLVTNKQIEFIEKFPLSTHSLTMVSRLVYHEYYEGLVRYITVTKLNKLSLQLDGQLKICFRRTYKKKYKNETQENLKKINDCLRISFPQAYAEWIMLYHSDLGALAESGNLEESDNLIL